MNLHLILVDLHIYFCYITLNEFNDKKTAFVQPNIKINGKSREFHVSCIIEPLPKIGNEIHLM